MSRTIYAFMVGIDDYPPGIPALRGCANDVDAFEAYLEDRVDKQAGAVLKVKTLKNAAATRQALIDQFRAHFESAREGDVALFYYSGHGSQEQAPAEFWKLEPDHLDETLVCHDSRNEGCWDLADKELAKLIAQVAARGPHVAVVLDCCHSGSGTRNLEMEETAVRRAPTDLRRRPIGSFIVTAEEAARGVGKGRSGWSAARGKHVLFAACRDNEEAKEYYGEGKHRGAFSFFLNDALRTASGTPTYRELFSRAYALVSSQVKNQSPQLEAVEGAELNAFFLDGVVKPSPAAFTASSRGGQWFISGGAAHGIPATLGDDAATFALFPFDASAAVMGDTAKALGTARVVSVQPTTSRVEIEGVKNLAPTMTFKAVVLSLPTPALAVRLEGDGPARELIRKALAKAGPGGKPSLFVREAAADDQPEFRLLAVENQYVIAKPGDDRPLVAQINGWTAASATLAVGRLEHIARWSQTARLGNLTSSIKPADVTIGFLVDDKPVEHRELRLEYKLEGKDWVAPTFKLTLTNTGKRRLYCGLLDLTELFKVDAELMEEGCIALDPGETKWVLDGIELTAQVPDEFWAQGRPEFKDVLKLIVSTQEFDARLLGQEALDMPIKAVGTRAISRDSTLTRLMRQVQTRDVGRSKPATIDDWQATELTFTTVRPLATTSLAAAGRSAMLAGGVTIEGHPTFRASARLTTVSLSTHDLEGVSLPRILRDDPAVSRPLALFTSRGTDPGVSVLELTDMVQPASVTPDSPLRVTVPVPLAANENVLPLAYDGEFFLPLGRVVGRSADSTEIALDRLPSPLADARSLGGAIKIFFDKVISRVMGTEFEYPILAAVEVSPNGTVNPIRDNAQVRQRVSAAKKILLFVHGIIGDTQSMVPSVQLAKLANAQPLASLYDVILTFDYENLNTTIEDNGRALKARLEAVGLGVGHGKAFDIAAHSMGGLVSRWFIEREGGNRIARRLIMLGTPNGGSPWPRVFDWATVALGLGLNNLTTIAWPASVVGSLVGQIESPTVALDEMLSNSKVLAALKASADPGIPYVMLAGQTSIIPAATAAPDAAKPSPLSRLLVRLTSPKLLYEVANPFFLGQTNDVAVSVASMENIAAGRTPACDVRPVACDHLSYFSDPAGLKALAQALSDS